MKIAILTFLVSTQLFAQAEYNAVEITDKNEKIMYADALSSAGIGIYFQKVQNFCNVDGFNADWARFFVSKKERVIIVQMESRYTYPDGPLLKNRRIIKLDKTFKKIEGLVLERSRVTFSNKGNLLKPVDVAFDKIITEVIDCNTGKVSFREEE